MFHEQGRKIKKFDLCSNRSKRNVPLTEVESSVDVHPRETEVAVVDMTRRRGGDGGSLSRVFPVTSEEAGPAPFVLNAWTENVYIVDFFRLETIASSLEWAWFSIVLNVYGFSDPRTL